MVKPNNYENTKVGGDFTPIIPGGHHLIIKNVEETTSKGGKPMLKVSFDFAKNDKQVLCDMGGRPYTRQYFEHPGRYNFLETSSRGHNVPIVNGKYQGNGGERATTTFENGEVKMEFASIYHQKELTKLLRTFKGDENGVTVTDEFIGAKQFTERLVTPFEPTIEDGKITVEGVTITFDTLPGVRCALI